MYCTTCSMSETNLTCKKYHADTQILYWEHKSVEETFTVCSVNALQKENSLLQLYLKSLYQ